MSSPPLPRADATPADPLAVAVAAVVARLERTPARAGGTRVVAVDGPSGAGKTVLADRLGVTLGAPVVHMDDLYPGWDGLEAAVPRLVDDVLRPLASGAPAGYRRWDWTADRYAEWRPVAAVPVLVVEGVGSGARSAAAYASLLVWVDAPAGERRRRGLARDGTSYAPHWERWARQERAHFAREATQARADLRVST